MLSRFRQILRQTNMAIDLGTAGTRMYACEPGMIAEEPSIIRNIRPIGPDKNPDPYLAYLNEKFVQSPLRGGVVVDVPAAVRLLKPLFNRLHKGLRHPVSLACAPTDSSDKERMRLSEAVLKAGAAHVAIIPEPWVAALGAGMDPNLPQAQMLVDIGAGVTDMALFKDGRMIFCAALRMACNDIHKALRTAVLLRHRVFIYPADLERLTHAMDASFSACDIPMETISVKGMDIVRGAETMVEVSRAEIIKAMDPVISRILNMIKANMDGLPEHLIRDITKTGICLTGGGACIIGMDRMLALKTGHKVWLAQDPIHAVINGAVQTIQKIKDVESWWEKLNWPQTAVS